MCSVAHNDMCEKFFHLFIPIAWFCLFVLSSGEMSVFCLKTNCMEQNPSWEANSSSASQKTPCIVCNPKVHYHIHKSLPPVPILNLIDPTHATHPTSWRLILILFSHLFCCLPSYLFPSGFPTKTLYTLHSPVSAMFPAHPILLDIITQIMFGEECWS